MRLDVALVQQGLARSRAQAAALISEGRVALNGRPATKAALPVGPNDVLTADSEPWVSRAAHKLLGALGPSGFTVRGRVLDAGASTGGFTQVSLDSGADLVYAVDVGHDQLASALRNDPRVRVREGLNLRELTTAQLDGVPVDRVVADVSFISLRLLLAPLLAVLARDGEALLLVKPQFEVGRERLGKGGVVRDERLRRESVDLVSADAALLGWQERWRGVSPLPGAAGNVEYFVRFTR